MDLKKFACQQLTPRSHERSAFPTEAWWTNQVVCAKAGCTSAPTASERFFKELVPLKGPPLHLFADEGHEMITAFTEVRQPYCSMQPQSWITYHTFLMLEINGGESFMLCERKSDLLEILIGEQGMPQQSVERFRANGAGRNLDKCLELARVELTSLIYVKDLFDWLDGPVEENWNGYDMLAANCQHFVADLRRFLEDPKRAWAQKPDICKLIPKGVQDRNSLAKAFLDDWRALKYANQQFRGDRAVVLTAIEQDGRALRYADADLRKDRLVVLAALQQNGDALPFVDWNLLNDKEIILTAVGQSGGVLPYASVGARKDKSVALSAVRSEAYAWRYVHPEIRWHMDVFLAASWQNPFAVARQMFFF